MPTDPTSSLLPAVGTSPLLSITSVRSDEAEFEVGDLGVLDTEVPPTEHLVAHVDVVAVA